MAQFYTLEEAARVLGMSPEELKAKAQHREVRAFLDGGSWRFRVADVDELARRRGLGSDAELHLSDLDMPGRRRRRARTSTSPSSRWAPPAPTSASRPANSPPRRLGLRPRHPARRPVAAPQPGDRLQLGDHRHGARRQAAERLRRPARARQPQGGQRLRRPAGRPTQDYKAPSDSDVTLIADDTSHHERSRAGSGDTAVRQSPMVGSSAEVPAHPDSDSDFELTPSSVIDALQPDSGSDFELSALEGSDEFEATPLRKPGDSDVTAADPGLSGINLSRPSDSGINLQMASGLGLGGADSIELAPLSGVRHQGRPAARGQARAAEAGRASRSPSSRPPRRRPPARATRTSSTTPTSRSTPSAPTTTRRPDRPARSRQRLRAGGERHRLRGLRDRRGRRRPERRHRHRRRCRRSTRTRRRTTGSTRRPRARCRPAPGTSRASRGSAPAGRAAPAAVLAAAAASAEWGGLWVGMLGVAAVFMLLLAFVSMDLVRNLYDFRADTPASGIVKSIAGLIASS